MSPAAFTAPIQITSAMTPFVAAVAILEGLAVSFDATGKVTLSNNSVASPAPAIGISMNNARVGETVYVQSTGLVTVPRNGSATILPGAIVGDLAGTGVLVDLTFSLGSLGLAVLEPYIGILISQSATTNTVYLCTVRQGAAGITNQVNSAIDLLNTGQVQVVGTSFTFNGNAVSTGAAATFNDNITPTTFNTNNEYVLPSAPNPLTSLQVFINSEAIAKAGCDRLLVQGVDYHLIGPANTHIKYDVTPTATNTIRCFYRS